MQVRAEKTTRVGAQTPALTDIPAPDVSETIKRVDNELKRDTPVGVMRCSFCGASRSDS